MAEVRACREEKVHDLSAGQVSPGRAEKDHDLRMAEAKAVSIKKGHDLSTGQARIGRAEKVHGLSTGQPKPGDEEIDRDLSMETAKPEVVGKDHGLPIDQLKAGRTSRLRGETAAIPEQSSVATDLLADDSGVLRDPTMQNAVKSDPAFAARVRDSNANFRQRSKLGRSLAAKDHQSTKAALIDKRQCDNRSDYQIAETRYFIALVDAPPPDGQQNEDYSQRRSQPFMDGNHSRRQCSGGLALPPPSRGAG